MVSEHIWLCRFSCGVRGHLLYIVADFLGGAVTREKGQIISDREGLFALHNLCRNGNCFGYL